MKACEPFFTDGKRLIVAGTQNPPKNNVDGKYSDFGRIDVFEIESGLPVECTL